MAGVVDADTHVAESLRMWEHLDKEMYPRRPVPVSVPNDTLYGKRNVFWLIDGNIFPKPAGKGGFPLITPSQQEQESARTDMLVACRELTDPEARLRDMDRLGVEIQVVYPTLFLIYVTDDVELEIALCRTYNRFMAQACGETRGRVRWIVIPPLRSVEQSIEEMQFAKAHGAVGVFFRGMERDRTLDDPYFFPIYEEASHLDMPICVHTGAGCPTFTNLFTFERSHTFSTIRIPPVIAFRDIVANRIPELFPKIRFGFIEAAASWVPYVLHALKRLFGESRGGYGPTLFRQQRLFVACEADEDIPYLARYIGEENLLIGSDYGHHGDPSNEPQLVATLKARRDIPDKFLDKLLSRNAREFYALPS